VPSKISTDTKAEKNPIGSRSWLPVVAKRWFSVEPATKIFMQDDHYNTSDLVHRQGHLDDAGKPGAEKLARRVWREAFGKGLQ
jgi:hypothetical protein